MMRGVFMEEKDCQDLKRILGDVLREVQRDTRRGREPLVNEEKLQMYVDFFNVR